MSTLGHDIFDTKNSINIILYILIMIFLFSYIRKVMDDLSGYGKRNLQGKGEREKKISISQCEQDVDDGVASQHCIRMLERVQAGS